MKRIPNFPDSKKLTLDDKDEIESFVRKFPPYSDYNFTSLYCYNVNDKVEVSWLNDNLVVLFQDYTSDELFYSFLGDNLVTETALTLLMHPKNIGVKNELQLIPECTRNILNGHSSLDIREDKNNFDYILSATVLSAYQGKYFTTHRYRVNQFKRKYTKHEIRVLDFEKIETRKQVLDLFYVWTETKSVPLNEAEHELKALERLLFAVEQLNIVGIGIFVQEKLVSFTIKQLLENDYAIYHFDKSDLSFVGVTPYMRQVSAKYLMDQGFRHINFEQDLGIEGLREAKQLLRPTMHLKKYIITKNNNSATS